MTDAAEPCPRAGPHTLDPARFAASMHARGHAVIPGLLSPAECRAMASRYAGETSFRSHVVMRRHGYGEGEYKYFRYPLPEAVQSLRERLYPPLAEVANTWAERLGEDERFPATLERYLERCHRAGQTRPTPLLLRYRAGDYNRLHQDLYGALRFPVQVAVLLDRPGMDFEGGEFVLTEQKPRSQSRVDVVPLAQGDAVAFAVDRRPGRGPRGYHRLRMRHGVSEVRTGQRHTLGIIFHDAA